MTIERDLDTILAAWLDEGPVDLPDATRRAIATALPTTTQARRGRLAPWRLQMNGFARLAAAAIVVVLAAGAIYVFNSTSSVGPGSSPTPQPIAPSAGPIATVPAPTPTPLDPTTWVPFTSPRLGISAKFPADFSVTAATTTWAWQTHDPGPDQTATDRAIDPGRAAFVIASEKIPKGMSEAAWWTDYTSGSTEGANLLCFPASRDDYVKVTVDGQTGYLHGAKVGCNFTEVIVVTGGRAYQLSGYPNFDRPTDSVFDQAEFDAWLGTIHLDPASANDG